MADGAGRDKGVLKKGCDPRPRRPRFSLLIASLCLLLAIGSASAFADGSEEEPGSQPTAQDYLKALEDPSTRIEGPQTDLQAAEELPHVELGREEAEELLTAVFPEQLQAPAGTFDELEVEHFISDHVAVVPGEATEPQPALLQSLLPLRVENSEGKKEAVDLDLEHAAGELQPANPIVEVGVPSELGEGISLPETGVEIELPDAPAERGATTVAESMAFYPNIATDTDITIAPTPTGVETLTQLRSASAPRSEIFTLNLPEGARLEQIDGGGAQVLQGSDTLLSIFPPTALDSRGDSVPASLKVSGDSIVIEVSPGEDATYPILIDPVYETYYWSLNHSTEGIEDWVAASNSALFEARSWGYGGEEKGLNIYSYGGWVPPGTQANWNYHVPRFFSDYQSLGTRPTSYIDNMTLSNVNWWIESDSPPYPANPFVMAGIWSENKGWWANVGVRTGADGQMFNATIPLPNYDHVTDVKNGGVALAADQDTNSRPRHLWVGQASVEVTDQDYPGFGLVGGPKNWVNQTATEPISVKVTDNGLGIYALLAKTPNTSGSISQWEQTLGCFGNTGHPCPRTWEGAYWTYYPSAMPQGEDFVEMIGKDPVWHFSDQAGTQAYAKVKVDHTAPSLAISGTITEQKTLGTRRPKYTLNMNATDGTTAAPQSGASKVVLKVDGKSEYEYAPGCSNKNCEITRELNLNSAHYSDGPHALEVIATDGVGLSTTKILAAEFFPDRTAPTVALSGSMTEQSLLGTTRPRYALQVRASDPPAGDGSWQYASSIGSAGSGNGQFGHPGQVALDAKGNLWAVDEENNRVEKFNEKGEYVSKFGTTGTGNGQFKAPTSVAVDLKGNIWVLDGGNNRVEKFNEKGEYVSKFGTTGTGNGQFKAPESLTVDLKGNVWVADTHNGRLQKFNEKGEFVKVVSSKGSAPGQLGEPSGIDIGPGGNVWVADWQYHRVVEFNEAGEYVRQFGTQGSGNGQLNHPSAISVDDLGRVLVGDEYNNRVEQFTEKGEYVSKFGYLGSGNDQFDFYYGLGIAADSQGHIWISDANNHRVQKWAWGSTSVPTYASSIGSAGSGNGQFGHPGTVALDAKGNLWAVDEENNRVQKFNEKGEYVSKFGSAGTGNGQFNRPTSVAVDPKGNIWVADAGNNRVEKFNEKGEYLTKFGTGGEGNGQLKGPEALTIDPKGNIWVADTYNGRLQKFNEAGAFVKVVSSKGSGPGQLGEPAGIDVGPGGNVWVADWQYHRVVEFNEAGEYVRQFGTQGSANGQFNHPSAISVDDLGRVLVGDEYNNRVEQFTEKGEYVSKFGYLGSGNDQFDFYYGLGIAADSQGHIWISDANNHRVQKWAWSEAGQFGVESTEIKVDGKVVDSSSPGCSSGGCSISREWTLDSSAYSVGQHNVEVTAADVGGSSATKKWTIATAKDTTAPLITTSGAFFNAPEGWVEQHSYSYSASAADSGYGSTSMTLKIDGATVNTTSQTCADGGCEEVLSGSINMANYSGGAHPAELIATDGAGNVAKKTWTINVDPKGQISQPEATATLEAVEKTNGETVVSPNPVPGESEEEYAILLKQGGPVFHTTGAPSETTMTEDPADGFIVQTSEGPVAIEPILTAGNATNAEITSGVAAISSNTAGSVDSVIRPIYDGAFTFQTIRDNSAPEEYAWQVELEEDQYLTLLDSQHAEVFYEGGHPAFGIAVGTAHDAVGTTVPTTLSVSGGDTVTMTVHHKAGGSFVYPVVAGAGWEGGFHTYTAEMPPPEFPPEYWESADLYVSAPEPIPSGEASISTVGGSRKTFVRVICGRTSFYRPDESYTEACGNPFTGNKGLSLWQAAMRGAFLYKPGAWVEQKGAHACDQAAYQNSVLSLYYVKEAWQCHYGPTTSDGNGGQKVSAGHYLRAQAHWEVGHRAHCGDECGGTPNPTFWEDKALELHLWPSGEIDRVVPSG